MSLFDGTMNEEKRRALELAEENREREWRYPSFALKLFHGTMDWSMITPFPRQSEADRAEGDRFLRRLEEVLRTRLDPDEVDRTGEVPPDLIKALAEIKAFAIKIPKAYGGLGMSQVNYNRAVHLIASYCGSTAVTVSAHQSIGVPQPLIHFGTEAQKAAYLPRFAEGLLSGFALTEPEAGSDPARMRTTATPVEDGSAYLLNGEKLWCTNGDIAGVLVVMALTPSRIVDGREKKRITAFLVPTDTPGFEVAHRCRFMGLNGIHNALLRLHDVRVPRENIIGGEGEGLKLALVTLNTGRLTLPAASAGIAKWCLHVARQWSVKRRQWGMPIAEHESIAAKLSWIAAQTFAMDAVTRLTSAMADDETKDIRLEAAMAKAFCTERCWEIVDETLQIRGGQGYERSSSLRERGMDYWPVERVLRDVRINRIIEGTSEIMRLFIAREALDPHLRRLIPLLKGGGLAATLRAAGSAAAYYGRWVPRQWLPPAAVPFDPPILRRHAWWAASTARRLARVLWGRMVRHGKSLEARQLILGRLVDIGTELFVMGTVCSYAQGLKDEDGEAHDAVALADLYCRQAVRRIEGCFRALRRNDDPLLRRVGKRVASGEYRWLEDDILT